MERPPGYLAAVEQARSRYAALPADRPVRLAKRTSNLFRPRTGEVAHLDLSPFTGVLARRPASSQEPGTALVGGLTTYEQLTGELLHGGPGEGPAIPLVVPQLRTITLGGAVVGLGIESSSFRSGLPHESVLEADVLTGSGEVVTARPEGEHADLFHALANSYGTLGYCLGLVVELEAAQPFVALRHERFTDLDAALDAVGEVMAAGAYAGEGVDFLDGVVFSGTESYLTLGRWVSAEEALGSVPGGPSDYTGQQIYYRSVQHRRRDLLRAEDYLWRWDTDWFWCSRALGVQHPAVRRVWPARWRRSDVYRRIIGLEERYAPQARLRRLRGLPDQERVVQDVEIPLERTAEFLRWFLRTVPVEPLWLCPVRLRDTSEPRPWPLYPMEAGRDYVNVGFWSAVDIAPGGRDGDVNRAIEDKVTELGGHKGLYSTATYDRQTFDELYGGDTYARVKARYDPDGRLPSLYDKAVGSR
ncbi:FAD/FMN-containing dehydrogenase [Serinicoccus hydrothermalis]|uniref:FAD/FMN-containing dehydrogenase n=1 Tax=Serinicoccus hydrothermalis TaxID=1758689 RepID=A0A1B1NAB8_9MICO|nr:FAD-binding oxidoreductase [Serinicoccus hydrothermalis]ANS78376.1 FAD/FMN-containing dehydrogenase [Serinicoccus hydrothermalis]